MSQTIDLKIQGDEAWPELIEMNVDELPTDHLDVAFLDNGTEGGQPVVLIRADKDGTAYIVQITGKQFQGLAAAFKGKYGVI